MKIFVFAAVAVAFLQAVSADRYDDDCRVFNPIRPCNKCDFSRSYVQYAVNPCNRTEYFSCEKTKGYITAHKQVCPCGQWFSDETWGCTDTAYPRPDPPCPTETPITEIIWHTTHCYRYGNGPAGLYLQEYSVVTDADYDVTYYWWVNEFPVKMKCPAGTYFNFGECKCIHCDGHIPCAGWNPVDVVLDWSDWAGDRKVWYAADTTCDVTSVGHNLILNGLNCDVEVPWFQKNTFSEFTLCLTFFPTRGGTAGLVFDGGRPSDDCHPSIFLELDNNNHLVGGLWTGGAPTSVYGPQVSLYTWTSACLRYDGKFVEILVGSTSVKVAASGTTELNRCNMQLGANVNQANGEYQYFQGQFGKFAFSRTFIDPVANNMI